MNSENCIKIFCFLFFLFNSSFSISIPNHSQGLPFVPKPTNNRPIIGILTQVSHGYYLSQGDQYLTNDYVGWIEAAGGRVVPIKYDSTEAELEHLYNSLNGVLFTGGELDLQNSPVYMKTANTSNLAKNGYDKNKDYFPIWGTCQGFQLLSILAAQNYSVLLVNEYDAENISLNLNPIDQEVQTSRFFNFMPEDVKEDFFTKNITMNLHQNGVPPDYFSSNPELGSFFKLTTSNQDRKEKLFGSTMEAFNYPIYAVQWHPERVSFDWSVNETALHHDFNAVRAMEYVAEFLVEESRRNNHTFETEEEEYNALIYNYPAIYTQYKDDSPYSETLVYFFNNTSTV